MGFKRAGRFQNLRWALCGPARMQHVRRLLEPSESWGPARQEHRTQQASTMEPSVLFHHATPGSEREYIIPGGLASLHSPGDSYI